MRESSFARPGNRLFKWVRRRVCPEVPDDRMEPSWIAETSGQVSVLAFFEEIVITVFAGLVGR